MKMKQRMAAVLAACLLTCGTAGAEQLPASVQRLADLTAAAAMDSGGRLRSVEPGTQLDPDFVYELLTCGQNGYEDLGINAELLLDPQLQADWLSAHFVPQAGDLAGILWFEEERPQVSVAVTAVEESDAGDAAVLFGEIRQDGQSTGLCVRIDVRRDLPDAQTWKIERFALNSAAQEDWANELFVRSMIEYASPELGFSVMYPALFAEAAEEDSSGVRGWLTDGSAEFCVNVTLPEHRAGETQESVIAGLREEHPDLTLEINEASGLILARWQEAGKRVCRGYHVTDEVLCMARIAWDPALHPELEQLSEYMMNSLSMDALGVG